MTVLDTNIVLYLLGGRLAQPLPAGAYAMSVITEMELLSFPGLLPAEEDAVKEVSRERHACGADRCRAGYRRRVASRSSVEASGRSRCGDGCEPERQVADQ